MTNSYVGVLLSRRMFEGIRSGNTGHEALLQYVITGQQFGVTPCFLRLRDMRPGNAKVQGYVWRNQKYVVKQIPMPAVIHNRAIYKGKRQNKKIQRLAKNGMVVFNQCNRYGKGFIHKLLMQSDCIRCHLPETHPASATKIRDMMTRFTELIVKPNNSSIGKGIMMLDRSEAGGWRLQYQQKISKRMVIVQFDVGGDLPNYLLKVIRQKRYLVQQRLPLAKYEERPFDIRVSVQRNDSGQWQITGMVGKVAKGASFLTNVAQGGEVLSLELLISAFPALKLEHVVADITRFSLQVAEHLSLSLPALADIGLDIGITESGFPMFIECNGRDLRYSFLLGGLKEEWVRTYGNPMGYASYLLGHPHL